MPERHDRIPSSQPSGMLVPVQGRSASEPPSPRPLAGFVTQLLACERRLAAFRQRRRAEPGQATQHYEARGASGGARSAFERVL